MYCRNRERKTGDSAGAPCAALARVGEYRYRREASCSSAAASAGKTSIRNQTAGQRHGAARRIASGDVSICDKNGKLEVSLENLPKLAEKHSLYIGAFSELHYVQATDMGTHLMERFEAFKNDAPKLTDATRYLTDIEFMEGFKGFRAVVLFEVADMVRSGSITESQLNSLLNLRESALDDLGSLAAMQADMRQDMADAMNVKRNKFFERWRNTDGRVKEIMDRYGQAYSGPDFSAHAVVDRGQIVFHNVRSLDDMIRSAKTLVARYNALYEKTLQAVGNHEKGLADCAQLKSDINALEKEIDALEERCKSINKRADNLDAKIGNKETALAKLEEECANYRDSMLKTQSKALDDLPDELKAKTVDSAELRKMLTEEARVQMAAAGTGIAINNAISHSDRIFNARSAIRASRAPGALVIASLLFTARDFIHYLDASGTDEAPQAAYNAMSSLAGTLAATAVTVEGFYIAGLRLSEEAAKAHSAVQKAVGISRLGIFASAAFATVAISLGAAGHVTVLNSARDRGTNAAAVAAAVSLVGDSVQIIGTAMSVFCTANKSWGFWKTLLLGARGANLVLLAGFILAEVGMYFYNTFQRSPLQSWAEKCVWGVKSVGWDRGTQAEELNMVFSAPYVSAREYWTVPTYDNYERPVPPYLVGAGFRLHFQDLWRYEEPVIGLVRVTGRIGGRVYDLTSHVEIKLSYKMLDSLTMDLELKDCEFTRNVGNWTSAYLNVDIRTKHPKYDNLMYGEDGLRFRHKLGGNAAKMHGVERVIESLPPDEDVKYRVGDFRLVAVSGGNGGADERV